MEMIAEEGPFSNVINLTEGEVVLVQKEWTGDGNQLCRICANTADYLIPIYEGQGLEHKLEEKIIQHLPIKVSQTDVLSIVVCYQCASTIIAFDTLHANCLEAEKKLKDLARENESKETVKPFQDTILLALDSDDEPLIQSRNKSLLESTKSSPIKKKILSKTKKPVKSEKTAETETKDQEGESERWILPQGDTYQCHACGINHPTRTDYQQHMLTQHQITVYHCNACNQMVATDKRDLIKHMRTHFQRTVQYLCEICSAVFYTKRQFMLHWRKHEKHGSKDRRYVCHQCGQVLSGPSGLRYHLRHVHAGVRDAQCKHCGRKFANRAVRDDHERTHTGERPFLCPICGKGFGSRAGLYSHKRSHTDFFPFACTICTRAFRWQQQLIAHTRAHTGEKKYICATCKRAFRVRNELTRHLIVHRNEKPFLCLVCGLTFAQKRYLRNHENSRHKD